MRTQKFMRAVTGATLADIMAKRNQMPEVRKAQREQAVRAAKEKKQAKEAKKEKKVEAKAAGKAPKPKAAKVAAPKAPKMKSAGGNVNELYVNQHMVSTACFIWASRAVLAVSYQSTFIIVPAVQCVASSYFNIF